MSEGEEDFGREYEINSGRAHVSAYVLLAGLGLNRRLWAGLCKLSALTRAGRRLDVGSADTPTLGGWASVRLRLLRASTDPGGKQSGQRRTILATCSTSPGVSLAMTSCEGWRSEIRKRAAATVGDTPALAAHSVHSRSSEMP